MGLFSFNDPPQQVITPDEFERVLNLVNNRHEMVPHDVFERWRAMAEGHLKESGPYRGMDEKELSAYIKKLPLITPEAYRSVVKDLHKELQKALEKSRYGSTSPF